MDKIICINTDIIKDIPSYSYGGWKVGNIYLAEKDYDDSTMYTYNIHTLDKYYINSMTTYEYDKCFITLNDWRHNQINMVLDE